MKVVALLIIIGMGLLLSSCGSAKSECPTIPTYPKAQSLGYNQSSSVRRISSYRSTDSSQQIIDYYTMQLRKLDWEVVNDTPQKFAALYTSDREKPPFRLDIAFKAIELDRTDFEVYLTISGPYAGFESWCTSLKP